jgi:hypothetical protein
VKTQEVALEEMKASFEGWDPRYEELNTKRGALLIVSGYKS